MSSILLCHGYLLEGSGSNLWTRCVLNSLAKSGRDAHIYCQEPHPELYDFISEAYIYENGVKRCILKRPSLHNGRVVMHKVKLSHLPVYVQDSYEEFPAENVQPIPQCSDDQLSSYITTNEQVLSTIIAEVRPTFVIVNHVVLLSEAVRRACASSQVDFALMPHGSSLEYAVKKDSRMMKISHNVMNQAKVVLTISDEIQERLSSVFGNNYTNKFVGLPLGVDVASFTTVPLSQRFQGYARLKDSLQRWISDESIVGRSLNQNIRVERSLSEKLDLKKLQQLCSESWYPRKGPDSDAVEKLDRIKWDTDQVLLFVGRLLSGKGIACLLAALPLLCQKMELLDPSSSTHLVVVGHGPFREIAEALLFALKTRNESLLDSLVKQIAFLEGDSTDEPLPELDSFFFELRKNEQLDDYFNQVEKFADNIIFLGYLTHSYLSLLYPLVNYCVFPSIVKEAGPLVALEAVSCGVLFQGVYYAGMKSTIDRLSNVLNSDVINAMKLSTNRTQIINDIVDKFPILLKESTNDQLRSVLRQFAEDRLDWSHCVGIILEQMQ
ncbi:hypothetical protein P9112_012136 [Eukaryota sp. TZLM1-RC]